MLRSSAVLPDAILGLLSPETVLHWCSPDALGDGQEQSLSHQARLCGEGGVSWMISCSKGMLGQIPGFEGGSLSKVLWD